MTLERDTFAEHLQLRKFESIADVVTAKDQVGSFDAAAFAEELTQSLTSGQFRLVLVLDDAPPELVPLVGYLEAITDGLIIDLITVASYNIAGTTIIVPQRVEPDRSVSRPEGVRPPISKDTGYYVEGAGGFVTSLDIAPEACRDDLRRLTDWAISLEQEQIAKIGTYHGKSGIFTLLPLPRDAEVGLVTIYNSKSADLQVWRSVFIRRAPKALENLENHIAPTQIGQGSIIKSFDATLLALLTDAYREAAGNQPKIVRQPPDVSAASNVANG
ncbi:MAG: hypothetical protein M3R06_04290 [Chloroflexota bacterium]|nr:hypothetical protein [Chloroflexota bacterium]